MMKDICKVLNADLESVLNGEYDSFANIDYDEKLYWVRICRHDALSVCVPTNNINIKWEVIYTLYFGRDENCSTKIAEFRFFDGEPKKHIVNQMSQIILHWISKTRIKKPKEKKCEFKYLDEDEARINKASENLGMKFETCDDFEHERDQSISNLIDVNEKLTKENDKLSVDISREKAKHDAATEKCKELAEDAKYWNRKTFEMDQKNFELRSRNRELEKELAEKSKQFDMRIEVTPETCYQIDILARKIDRLEKENKNCKGMLDRIHEIIEGDISNMTDETDHKKNPKEFREILVRECFGRPYYEILYKEDGKMHVGYSSYKLDKVSEWLKEFFID